MAGSRKYLIRGLKLWFDLILVGGTLAVSLILVFGIGTSFQEEDRADWTVSVPIGLGEGQLKPILILPAEALEHQGVTEMALVDGRGELRFDTLDNVLYLGSISYFVVGGCIALWVIFLLRRILVATRRGEPFSHENVRTLMLMGWIMVGAGGIGPFLERRYVRWVLTHFESTGIALSPPPLGIRVETVVTGLLLLVLASVWKEAVAMAEEQSLTV